MSQRCKYAHALDTVCIECIDAFEYTPLRSSFLILHYCRIDHLSETTSTILLFYV